MKARTGPRKITAAVVMITLFTVLAGCARSAPTVTATAPTQPARPVGVQDPATIPPASGGTGPTCDATASLRPPASMPTPGAMPAGSTMAAIAGRGKLRVGVDQNTYKFGYLDPSTGTIVGFDIDMARAVAKAIFGDPNKVQLIAITAAQRIPYIQQNKVDIVVDTMTINCARRQMVDFSSVYFDAGQAVLVPVTSTARSIADLGGKKVCAAAGSTSIANIAAARSKPIPVAVNDWTDCLVMLQQGQVDAISTDNTILYGLADQDTNTKVLPGTFTDEPYGIAISKSTPDLTRFVNGVLAQMRSSGEWTREYQKWLGVAGQAPPAATYRD
jgi:polar amino acid transport system substrate-binding protein